MKDLRKALIVGVMSLTVFSMSMIAVPAEVGAASAGDLIKMDGLSSVYYLGADGKRYVFPNETTYFSWYADFSGVVTIPQSELESYPLGANVTMRPGTKLVKITTNPKVYAVEPDGMLLHVADEATAATLYGANWAKRVVDVPDAFFTNYTESSETVSDDAYPTGSLIKEEGSATIYYINAAGEAQAIADEAAFLANRFSFDNVLTSTIGIPTAGADITGAVADIIDTSSGAGGTAGAGTGLSVSIASDTPEAGNIPQGAPVEFLKITFTASADGDVSINSIKLSAYDLGTATNIDNVAFFYEGVKVGTAKNMTSDREAIFNFSTPLVIPAGTSKSYIVKATINAAAGNYAIGVKAAADVITNGAAVSGSFPIIGNTKAVVAATIGAVAMSNAGTTDTSNNFGEDDVLLASFRLTATNEAVLWESARFRNGGTNNADLLDSAYMDIDGDIVAEGATLVDKYLAFDLDNYQIAKNDAVNVKVYGDLGIGNALDTLNFYVKDADDLAFTGKEFGFGILPTIDGNLDGDGDGITVTLQAGDFTINMDKGATPAKDVRAGDDDVILATIEMTSNGENATSEGINANGGTEFQIQGTGLSAGEISNVEMRDADSGVIYDLTASSTSAGDAWDLSTDEEFAFIKGVTRKFQVRCDLSDSTTGTAIDNNDTLRVYLASGALSLTGDESDASITNITPSSVTGAYATVKDASLNVHVQALTNKSVVPGAQDVLVYKAVLEVGASSYVDLTQVQIDVLSDDGDTTGSFVDQNISQLELYLDGTLIKSRAGAIADDTDATPADNYILFSSLPSGDRRIAAGDTVNLEMYADFASTFATTSTFVLTSDDVAANILAQDMDGNDVAEVVTGATTGVRSVELQSAGNLKVELKTAKQSVNDDTYLLAGSETMADRYMAEIVFTTSNEPVVVKQLVLENTGTAHVDDIALVHLYDDEGTTIASEAVSTNGHCKFFTTTNLTLPADQATSYFLGVTAKSINGEGDSSGTADHGETIIYNFATSGPIALLGLTGTAIKAEGADSSQTITMTQDVDGTVANGEFTKATTTSKTVTISGSVVTSIVNDKADGTIINGQDKEIGKYTFVFDNGSNRNTDNSTLLGQLVELKLTVATSGVSVSDVKAFIQGYPSNIATSTASVNDTLWTLDLDAANGLDNYGKVDGSVTLVITADISGGGDTGDYLQTLISDIDGLNSDFTYNGNHGSGNNFTDPLLEIIKVDGATLQ